MSISDRKVSANEWEGLVRKTKRKTSQGYEDHAVLYADSLINEQKILIDHLLGDKSYKDMLVEALELELVAI